jgi:hypothetical protein
MRVNDALQWLGTLFILAMYVLMNFFRDLQLDALAGLLGGACYLAWTIRVANRPQMIVNVVAITVCALGLWRMYS